jgi:transcriptional regulator with XRE-family HTH domain
MFLLRHAVHLATARRIAKVNGKLAIMESTKSESGKRGLYRYFGPRQPASVEEARAAAGEKRAGTWLMSEIARLAVLREGLTQERLATLYNVITGTHIESRNIAEHFKRKPGANVIANYAKVLGLSDRYIDLLKTLDSGVPLTPKTMPILGEIYPLEKWADYYLRPAEVAHLYEEGAIDDAMRRLLTNEELAIRCVNNAMLAVCRNRYFGLKEDDLRVIWRIVEETLRRESGYDLGARATTKSPARLQLEETLASIFLLIDATIGFWKPLGEPVERLEWHEWEALRAQIESVFARRGIPVKDMRARLESTAWFREWEKSQNPEQEPAEKLQVP